MNKARIEKFFLDFLEYYYNKIYIIIFKVIRVKYLKKKLHYLYNKNLI